MKNKKVSTMNIRYFNKDHHEVLNMSTMGYMGSKFNVNQYINHVPSGYKFAGFLNRVPHSFDGHNHNIDIKVASTVKLPKVPNRMVIRFLNMDRNDMEVKQNVVSNKSKVKFDVNDYLAHHIPDGYSFKKMKGRVPTRFDGTQLIQVEVASQNSPQSSSSLSLGKMVIEYLDTRSNQIYKRLTIVGQDGSHFDVNRYITLKFIPQGYVFKGFGNINNIPLVFNATQTIKVMISPDHE